MFDRIHDGKLLRNLTVKGKNWVQIYKTYTYSWNYQKLTTNLDLKGPKTLGIGLTWWKNCHKSSWIGRSKTLNQIWSTVWLNWTRGRQQVVGCSRSNWMRTHRNRTTCHFWRMTCHLEMKMPTQSEAKDVSFWRNNLSFLLYNLSFLVEAKEMTCRFGLSSTFDQTKKWQHVGWLLQGFLLVRGGACDVKNGWSLWSLNRLGEKKQLVVLVAQKDEGTLWMIWG